MAKVTFKRYETDAEAQASNVVDGQFIVTGEGTAYTDYGTDRVAFGGLSYIEVLNFLYPVGSYYETSDTTFNPNTTWGGTWVLDTAGKVTVAKDENDTDFDTIGKTGGSKELQEHTHTYTIRNTSEVKGSASNPQDYPYYPAGNNWGSSNDWITSSAGTGNSGNLQPYIVVNRWHRTA